MGHLRRRARLVGALAAVGSASLALAASANAASVASATTKSFKGTNGFAIGVNGSSNFVSVTASKGNLSSTYSNQGTVGPKTLKADLGKFGKVDLKLHVTKTTHPKPVPGCTGKLTMKKGVWKGILKFKGENGYTKGSTKKIAGSYTSGSQTCSGTGGGPKKKYVVLNASDFSPPGGGFISFSASKLKSGGNPILSVIATDTDAGIGISRFGNSTGKAPDFTYNPGYTQATVKGSGPFSGTGNYNNGNWGGSLKAKLAGGSVDLTGSGFTANLGENQFKQHTNTP